MEATSMLLHSKPMPWSCLPPRRDGLSFRHFNKRLQVQASANNLNRRDKVNPLSGFCFSGDPLSLSWLRKRPSSLSPLKCSHADITSTEFQNPLLKPLNSMSFDSVRKTISELAPIGVVKWSAVLAVAIAAAKWTVNLVLNPFFWMYFSWAWIFWPWFVALSLAVYGFYCFQKHFRGEASIFEQLSIVTAVFTWLTLVPPAHFNGFLEGWPFVFFFVYHYFFFFNVSVRKRLYGDCYARPHDPKWDVNLPKWHSLLYCIGIMIGHWLAAFEGPELHLIPGGLNNVGIWIMIVVTLLMQYNATSYLAKYSEKVVVPTAVVQFGPYRWVRHPMYASTMLLFMTYCLALRAPLSLLFLLGVCVTYYEQKAKIEETLMVETFGDRYREYANKVRYKFIPFVY